MQYEYQMWWQLVYELDNVLCIHVAGDGRLTN